MAQCSQATRARQHIFVSIAMKKTNETSDTDAVGLADAPESTAAAPAKAPRKARGRPLSFDRDAALETAMHVFWERGYEAASIADLTSAMGITPPSLYTAFGDKEQLFLEAIERYALEAANELTQPCHPKGCMVVMAATNCSAAAERVQDALLLRRTEAIAAVGRRIQGGIDGGELPPDTDAKDLANFYATIYQGMSMQAKDGATHESLMATVRTAMRSWPRA